MFPDHTKEAFVFANLRKRIVAGLALVGMLTAGAVATTQPTGASSHREAPLISRDPLADNTDLYAFRSPDRPDTVTIVANYIPLEEPNGGPNFVSFGDDVRYEIHVDNNGDARPDTTYRFTFYTRIVNPNTFLYITLPILFNQPNNSYDNLNFQQYYKIEKITKRGVDVLGKDLLVAPNNVGPRSTPNYDAIAQAAIISLNDGIKVFAGPRDDAFFVDLGSIFDLGGLRPFNSFHLIPLPDEPGVDGVSRYNTHTITIQVPIDKLTADKKGAEDTKFPNLGIYASASRQSVHVLRTDGRTRDFGQWVQVSRLGNPLINEVIIPVGTQGLTV
jgi:hypothetical protein